MSNENISIEIFSGQATNEPKMDKVARQFLDDLQKEQTRLKEYFPICSLLIEEAYDRVYSWGQVPGHDYFADVMKLKPMKLVERVFVPIQDYPQLDLTKTVLNLKENIKYLESETQCQIFIKGRHSMCDEDREETLRLSKDPRFQHLNKELFLEITTEATAIDCHTRIAYALSEIRKYLLKQTNNEINEIQSVDLPTSNIEHIKIENFEEPPLDIDYKEPQLSPAKPLDTISESSNSNSANPIDIGLANKLIKLLDDTLLNPEFKNLGNDKNMLPSQIEPVADPINVSLDNESLSDADSINVSLDNEPLPVADPINASLDNEMENMPTTSAAAKTKTKLIKKKSSSDKLKRVANRRINKDSSKTKSINMKMEKLKAIKDKNSEDATQVKKQKYPAIFYIKDTKTDKIIKCKLSNKSSLGDFLKRFNNEKTNEPDCAEMSDDEYKPYTIEYLQRHPQELVFELTPKEIILSLLEVMEKYPVLWKYHEEAYNEDYSNAIEYLCEAMNDKWLLNIDHLQMCRSITRILRFYRFLFPFDVIDKFTDYFEKCAVFLPSAVIEIPHARCFQCCRCFKRDRDLVRHMTIEHDKLGWPYKCLHCHESFATNDEFELHKHLPHYLEVFTCQECNQKFSSYYSYNQHFPHQKSELPSTRYVCDICQKDFKNKSVLRLHKDLHMEKRYKCHLCPKVYHARTPLNMHLKKHRMDLNYICDVCGKCFVQNKDLKAHMNVHTGFKITCNICNMKVTKNNLYRHLRTIHVVYAGTIENNFRARGYRHTNGQPHGRRKETAPRHYKCKICKIQFERCKELKKHNIECHSDLISKLPCKLCDSIVTKSCNLKRHYREKHKLTDFQIRDIVIKNMDIKTVLTTTTPDELQKISEDIEITTGWESASEDTKHHFD